jgi:site-specific recombinase XerD
MHDDRFPHTITEEHYENYGTELVLNPKPPVPALIRNAGIHAERRCLEFFTADIRNPSTRRVYARAVSRFCDWCEVRRIALHAVSPFIVATYIEGMTREQSAPTVKQHLAAIRRLFDWLVVGQVLPINPAASVRGPKHVVKIGKTPVLTAGETRQLLDSIDCHTLIGLRDRALIGLLVYSFARVSAAIGMNVADYYPQGRRMWFRLHEKGGKEHAVPAHHNAEAYVDAYLDAAGAGAEKSVPLFRTVSRERQLTDRRMHRVDVLRMIKRRGAQAGIATRIGCHTFRATGITCYLLGGGSLEHAQRIAAHESARTTKLYDRTGDTISLDEIERISI